MGFCVMVMGVTLCRNKLALRKIPRICMPSPNIPALIQTDMARWTRLVTLNNSTRLVMLFKNIYTLWGRIYILYGVKLFLLPVTFVSENVLFHFPTSLVYPLTLGVTGITTLRVTGIIRYE